MVTPAHSCPRLRNGKSNARLWPKPRFDIQIQVQRTSKLKGPRQSGRQIFPRALSKDPHGS